jgi:hypothetical protein
MANSLTFDPSAGTPVAVNLTINSGADFINDFTVKTTSGSAFDFSGAGTTWTGSSQMAKSVSIGSSGYAVATFNVGFTSAAGGKFQISLGSTDTRSLTEGRYVYDVLVSSGTTVYKIIDGNIIVKPGISSAP